MAKEVQRVGVVNDTLFLYFKSKKELMRELSIEVSKQIDSLAWESSENMLFRERFLAAFSICLPYCLANSKEFNSGKQYRYSPFLN